MGSRPAQFKRQHIDHNWYCRYFRRQHLNQVKTLDNSTKPSPAQPSPAQPMHRYRGQGQLIFNSPSPDMCRPNIGICTLYLHKHFWGLKAGLEPEMQYAAPLPQNICMSVNLPNFV